MNEAELIEALSDEEHARWSHWTRYQFSQCQQREDGALIIPADLVERWRRQSETPYAELSEREKQSDRDLVERILPIIREYVNSQQAEEA